MRRSTSILAAAFAVLAVGVATATAGGSREDSYVVQPTTLGAAPSPATAGVYADAGGAYMYSTEGAISRLYNDPDGDFFTLMPRGARSFRLVVPGHADLRCAGTSVVRGIGGQWFPETPDGGSTPTDAHVLCPQPDGTEWRVFYPDSGCVTASRSGSAFVGSTWTVRAPGDCYADVQLKRSGKRTFSSVSTNGTVASSITDWRTR